MTYKYIRKFFMGSVAFVLMFVIGVLSFNLFYLNDKLKMLHIVNEFHRGQLNDDKKIIDNLLSDDFIEIGVRRFVQTPESIYKKQIINLEYPKAGVTSIEAKYPLLLSTFNNSETTLSFVKEITFSTENGKTLPPIIYYVTYYFEKTADGLKINKIERKF